MKKFSIISLTLCLLFLLSFFSFSSDTLELLTTSINEFEKQKILSKFSIEFSEIDKKISAGVRTFSINKEETEFALNYNNNTIRLFDINGNFQCEYKIKYSGSFCAEFDRKDNNLNVYLIRSKALVKIAKNGEILDIRNVEQTEENMDYWINLLHQDEIRMENSVYKLSKGIEIFGYSKVLKMENGQKQIIYNNGQSFFIRVIAYVSLAALLLIIFFILFYRILKSKYKNKELH